MFLTEVNIDTNTKYVILWTDEPTWNVRDIHESLGQR